MLRPKILGLAVALAALAGGWLVLRDAPIFAVQKVVITGLGGAWAPAVRASLEDAARGMTTTHLRAGRLRAAVASFAMVKGLRLQIRFPHGLGIQVIEESPVAALAVAGQRLPVAADGKIIRGIGALPDLATVPIAHIPTGERISDPVSVDAVELLDIGPPVLRAQVTRVILGPHGLTAELRGGPPLYFGDTTRLHAKWAAAARVLADSSARGALYLDLHDPERPAAQIGNRASGAVATSAPGTAGGPLLRGGTPAG